MKTICKSIVVIPVLLFILLCGISCRKETYSSGYQLKFQESQLIKHQELLKVIDTNPAFKLFGLDWSKAKQATLGGKALVRVPIENKVKFDISIFNPNLPQQKKVMGGSPFTRSTNYLEKHPPEIFFIQDTDSIRSYLLNFVPDKVNPKVGENGIWTGRLYEWNLSGSLVHIQDIMDSKLKRNYLMEIGASSSTKSDSRKVEGWIGEFFDWLGGIFSDVWDGLNWLFYHLGIPGFYTYDDWGIKSYRIWEFGGGDGGSYGGGAGRGGGYYNAGGDPVYGGYLPGYSPNDCMCSTYPNNPFTPYRYDPNLGVDLNPYALSYLQKEQATQITKKVVRAIEEQFWTEEPLTEYQLGVLSEVFLEEFAAEYYNNAGQFGEILAMQPGDDDKPFWEFLKKKLRQLLGYEQPETPEEREQLERIGANAKVTAIGLRNINEGYRLVPGMSLLQAMRENEGYTAATIDLSIDLFGGTFLKFIGSSFLKLSNKYVFKVSELATKYPNIAAKLKSFSISEFNIIKRSDTEKVIIIGEDMGKRILPAQEIFRKIFKNAETFTSSIAADEELQMLKQTLGRNLTDNELKSTLMYRENLNWIKNKLLEEYNVIDIGPKIPTVYKSAFYRMERSFIYKK